MKPEDYYGFWKGKTKEFAGTMFLWTKQAQSEYEQII